MITLTILLIHKTDFNFATRQNHKNIIMDDLHLKHLIKSKKDNKSKNKSNESCFRKFAKHA